MKTNLPRGVVLDLLPIYLAGESSPETHDLVEASLAEDPELARAAKEYQEEEMLEEIPVPLTREDELEAYQQANRLMVVRTLGVAAIIAVTFIVCIAMIFIPVAVLTLARIP